MSPMVMEKHLSHVRALQLKGKAASNKIPNSTFQNSPRGEFSILRHHGSNKKKHKDKINRYLILKKIILMLAHTYFPQYFLRVMLLIKQLIS